MLFSFSRWQCNTNFLNKCIDCVHTVPNYVDMFLRSQWLQGHCVHTVLNYVDMFLRSQWLRLRQHWVPVGNDCVDSRLSTWTQQKFTRSLKYRVFWQNEKGVTISCYCPYKRLELLINSWFLDSPVGNTRLMISELKNCKDNVFCASWRFYCITAMTTMLNITNVFKVCGESG